ncbi:RNA-binding protein [Canibacter zhoujuaniae]|uniref:RNA-binding protein n=1 Tax=Canibacter zhoujuaniae TaxID=2708343 RepID=UPI001422004C|nr:RNA-binding protein [Canibacter zhoujuaniae]
MSTVSLQDALKHLISGIVDRPEAVEIDSVESVRGETLEVRVHPDDLGRVIGRSGRTVQALRTVIGALARDRRVRIDIVDTDETA